MNWDDRNKLMKNISTFLAVIALAVGLTSAYYEPSVIKYFNKCVFILCAYLIINLIIAKILKLY